MQKILFFTLGAVVSLSLSFFILNTKHTITSDSPNQLISVSSIILQPEHVFEYDFYSVQGGWKANVNIVNARNSVSIHCNRITNQCTIAQADIIDEYFMNDLTYYEISSWDTTGGIIATSQDAGICDRQLLQITKDSVMLYESRKKDAPIEMCPIDKESSVTLELTHLYSEN